MAISFNKELTQFSYFARNGYFTVTETTEKGICKSNIARVIKIKDGFVFLDIFGLKLLNWRNCNLVELI